MDIGRQIAAQRLEQLRRILGVKFAHIITEGALQLAVGLWVTDRGVNQADAEVVTERREQLAFERRAIVKPHRVGDHLPLSHRRDECSDGRPLVWVQEEITEDVAPRVIIQEGEVIRRAIQIRQGHLFQAAPMPRAMGVMPLIKPPHGRGSGWGYRLLQCPLQALDGRGLISR